MIRRSTMKVMPLPFLLLVVIISSALGQEAAKKELGMLQGTWAMQKLDIPDEGPRKDFEKYGKVIIKGNKAVLMRANQKFAEFTIKVYPGRSPKAADLKIEFVISEKGKKDKAIGKTVLAIYTRKGDRLIVFCGEIGGKARPKKFPTKANQGQVTLKRQKGK
jgi:uncharacterized protein (TIGR03067 family)